MWGRCLTRFRMSAPGKSVEMTDLKQEKVNTRPFRHHSLIGRSDDFNLLAINHVEILQ